MHEESGWHKEHFIWAENDEFYYDDEALSSLEPLYPTNSRMILTFFETDVVIVYVVLKTRRKR